MEAGRGESSRSGAAEMQALESNTGYRYQQEIAQMVRCRSGRRMLTADVCLYRDRKPRPAGDPADRGHCAEPGDRDGACASQRAPGSRQIIQSRRLAQRRGSKYLAPEDLIFLIRYDRAKVNRLRTYLSWKDVRKNAKEGGGEGAGGPGAGGDVGDGLEETTVDSPIRVNKRKMKLPWELWSMFNDYPRISPASAAAEEEDEDEDQTEANEDSMRRLKAADETTRRMTREEYVYYSECRQASFTFRKSKLFREFIHAGHYLDVKPNDDTIDILGFLAFEVVHELCTNAMEIKHNWEERTRAMQAQAPRTREAEDAEETGEPLNEPACTLFSLPPSAEPPLEVWHIREAFAQLQRDRALLDKSQRYAGPVGGLRRTQVFVI